VKKTLSITDPWFDLKQHTSARIALGRAGGSLTTAEWLNFKLAHARARDAVQCEFDCHGLIKQLQQLGGKVLLVQSLVKNRAQYLQRPDLGRRLNSESRSILEDKKQSSDLVFIVSDGLSATAVHAHATNLLKLLLPKLYKSSCSIAPLVVARFGRVALQDEIGAFLGAKIAVILIGERPGLSSPDSLGAYLVHHPQSGNTDANRNCVSNIRPLGLDYEKAADTIFYLLTQARQRKLSGVKLKDDRQLLNAGEKPDVE